MKTFICEYHWSGAYGAYEKMTFVVHASSESEAFGKCLMFAEESSPDRRWWTIEEFTGDIEQVQWASS